MWIGVLEVPKWAQNILPNGRGTEDGFDIGVNQEPLQLPSIVLHRLRLEEEEEELVLEAGHSMLVPRARCGRPGEPSSKEGGRACMHDSRPSPESGIFQVVCSPTWKMGALF